VQSEGEQPGTIVRGNDDGNGRRALRHDLGIISGRSLTAEPLSRH
jgi:hypothetical protein